MPAYRGEHEDILRPFLDAMRFKLGANKHKGKRFEDTPTEKMFELLQGEVTELREALDNGNQFEIIFEAADIANFALFIATKAIREASRGEMVISQDPSVEVTNVHQTIIDPNETNYEQQGIWHPVAMDDNESVFMWKHKITGHIVYEDSIHTKLAKLPIAPWTLETVRRSAPRTL